MLSRKPAIDGKPSMQLHHKRLYQKIFGTGKKTKRGGLKPGKKERLKLRAAAESIEKIEKQQARTKKKALEEEMRRKLTRELRAANMSRVRLRSLISPRERVLMLTRRDPQTYGNMLQRHASSRNTTKLSLKLLKEAKHQLDTQKRKEIYMEMKREQQQAGYEDDPYEMSLAKGPIRDDDHHMLLTPPELDEIFNITRYREKRGKKRFGGSIRHTRKKETIADRVKEALAQTDDANKDEIKGLSSVMYISHIPPYFQEREMKDYFGQFGKILRVRLSRNMRTKASRHYGFIEFENPKVAHAVAKEHRLFHISNTNLVCKVIPMSELHPDCMSSRALKRDCQKIDAVRHNEASDQVEVQRNKKRIAQHAKRLRKVRELCGEYNYVQE